MGLALRRRQFEENPMSVEDFLRRQNDPRHGIEAAEDAGLMPNGGVAFGDNPPLTRPRLVENPVPVSDPLTRTADIPVTDAPPAPTPSFDARPFGVPLERPKEVRSDAQGNPVAPFQDALTRSEHYRENLAAEPPKKMGFWKRLGLGALMGLANADPRNGLAGMLGSAIGGGGANAAMPSLLPKMQQQRQLGEVDADIARLTKQEEGRIGRESDLARNDLTRANTEYAKERPALERDKLAQKRETALQKAEFDKWRIESGNRKQDEYAAWMDWRKANGDASLKTRQEYYEWQKAAAEARNEDRDLDRALKMSEGEKNRAQRYSRSQAKARLISAGLTEAEAEEELGK